MFFGEIIITDPFADYFSYHKDQHALMSARFSCDDALSNISIEDTVHIIYDPEKNRVMELIHNKNMYLKLESYLSGNKERTEKLPYFMLLVGVIFLWISVSCFRKVS
ncbi:MAG: hypothetical protein ACFHVJ_07160 [Aestuariibacter sp.]